ncbi:MAG: glycoside hydrolase family 16 protein [Lachnospiraceae bacterium]|nr:glycoside hydrolase family 16 protein [Lachnospiraceae bacterium]
MRKNIKFYSVTAILISCIACFTACGTGEKIVEKETTNVETVAEESLTTEDVTLEGVVEEASTEAPPVKEPEPYVDKPDRSDEGFELVWSDEFDGDALDTTKWDYMYGNGGEYGNSGWGNNEWQYYLSREENIRVEDGKLIIAAVKEDSAMPYTSARIRTITNRGETLFATTYGRVEARIKMPVGEGIWPAFWMLPVDDSIYGKWAASGEIDIMEAKGRLPQQFSGAAHFGGTWPNNTYETQEYVFPNGTDITDYHLYSVEWEPGEIRWYVDNECFFTLDNWFSKDAAGTMHEAPAPFDVPFYIILNMAVGGNFDPEADVDKTEFPVEMEVDFVRVYHKEEG